MSYLINATQSSMPTDKYGMVGKNKIYLVLLAEVHTPIPCENAFAYN